MKKSSVLVALILLFSDAYAQTPETYTGPIIDMHLHSYTNNNYWGGRDHPSGISSPKTAEEHWRLTEKIMAENNVKKAVIDSESIDFIKSQLSGDNMFIPGFNDGEGLPDVETFESLVKDGTIKVFGEVSAVYLGKTLNDSMYKPYLKICEKYGIPVAYHTGGGPPNTTYTCCPEFRLALGDPLLIEDVLVTYPDLKLYLMHGGELFYEHAIRMMKQYPQLHIDIGVLLWVDPIVKNYAVRMLKLAKTAGVLDRVMFGSDQMVWPKAIQASKDFLNSLDFISMQDKADIFYNNAARFLSLSEEEIKKHHNE